MIKTCVYINISLRNTLMQSVKRIGISRNALAHLLLNKVLQEKRLLEPKIFARVQYQPTDPAKEWTNIGIDLAPELFEKCQDMRKVLKMSVSFIFSFAIRTYLNQIINEYTSAQGVLNKTRDNYVHYYSIQSIFHSGIEGFIIKWTENPNKIVPPS